ncbi:septation protein SepH [Janibacter sp. G56]|uniref:septation protein SepH n=1 Tax=Janibacter sp. G56 TaxID=3418717 RepID=UPI003CFCA3B8
MRDLRLIGVHDDGNHLVLADESGEQFRIPLDESLRAAARRDRPRLGQLQIEIDSGVRPREIQSLIRSGLSATEVADRTGWSLDRIARYEGPVLAEREHVATLARRVMLRGRAAGSRTESLQQRVEHRLTGRGVEPSAAVWDSSRSPEGNWTVNVSFPAGGRDRRAVWFFDATGMSVVAKNDEARWLSEDEAASGPIPTPHQVGRPTSVYDVEAEGGVREGPTKRAPQRATKDEPIDLMTSMREHSDARRRRGGGSSGRRRRATATPADAAPREDALPIEELVAEPTTPPPPAHGEHPEDVARRAAAEAAPEGQERLPEVAPTLVDEPVVDEPVVDDTPVVDTTVADAEESTVDAEAQEREAVAASESPTLPEDEDVAPAAETEAIEPAEAAAESVEDAPSGSDEAASDDKPDTDAAEDKADTSAEAPSDQTSKKGRRTSVPSWDDVMFGAPRGRR